MTTNRFRDVRDAVLAAAGVGGVTLVASALGVGNPTTIALGYLLVVLLAAAASRLFVAVLASALAVLSFNFFFLPPVGGFTIADPQNWVALLVFLAVSLVGSHLSSVARARASEALERRDELGRLFEVSRDVLLSTDSRDALAQLTRSIARRFDLDYVAIAVPDGAGWDVASAGPIPVALDRDVLARAAADAQRPFESDAAGGSDGVQRTIRAGSVDVRIVPLRLGMRAIGVLAAAGRPIEPGSLDALGGIVAIAIERVQLLEDRKAAEVARQGEALKSALLASLGHDLRTPLTAIRIAATNLQASWLGEAERREQSQVVLAEVERLTRLFEGILDMARIDAGAVATEPQWVHPAQVVESARERVVHAVASHPLRLQVPDALVRLDPRLTSAALAHLLDNAAKYSAADAPIDVTVSLDGDNLEIAVRDHGPGIPANDLPHLFERFYRGAQAGRVSGEGMGLAIVRGLLAVEHGRVSAENCADGGACFTIAVPVEKRALEAAT